MFDDIIKNKADEHEAPVPPDAWDTIVQKKKKRRFAFWWWSSLAVLFIALSTGGYFLLKNKNNYTTAGVNEKGNTATQQKVIVAQSQANEIKTVNEVPFTDKNPAVTEKDIKTAMSESSNKQQLVAITGTARVKTTTTNPTIEEDEIKTVDRNNKNKKTKGKLQVRQNMPGIDENLAANGNIKAAISNPAVEEEIKESEENIQATIATIPGKKITTMEEENKTDNNKKEESPKTEDQKKEKTAAAKQKIKKHWFIEAAAIPLLASSQYNKNVPFNRTLSLNNGVSVYQANLVKASIEPAVAFSFLVRKELSKKVAIGTGLQYMLLKENMDINGKETNTTYTIVNRLQNGQLVPDTLTTVTEGTRSIKAVNSYHLFSIPVFIQYSLIQKQQWSVAAVGGFYFNISSNYKNEINRNAAAPLLTAPGTTNKSNTGIDIYAGIRISKRLTKRLDFFAMPSMRLSLAKYNIKNSLLDKNINQAGVGFGLCYKIN